MKAFACTNVRLDVVGLPSPTPAQGQLPHGTTVGLAGVAGAFDALGDPEAHAKILIDPKSERSLAS